MGAPGVSGPVGPTGPTGPPVQTTPRAAFVQVHPAFGQPVTATVDCLDGEQVVGGGARADISNPIDVPGFHLLENGPTDTGWIARGVAVSVFVPTSLLTFTATAFCQAVGAP